MADPVGVIEVAERLGVAHRTVHQWLHRGIVPPPDYESVNGSRAWEWATVLKWAGGTGHITAPAAQEEFERRFRRPPLGPRKGGRLAAAKPKPKKKSTVKKKAAKPRMEAAS